MSIFPFLNLKEVEVPNNKPLPLYREIAWNFEKDKPIIENGDFKLVEGNEAIKIWCYKALLTQRYEFQIYSWNYGSEVMSLIGSNYSKALTEAELKRYIQEALIINPYILEVNVIDTSFGDCLLSAKVKVKTIYEGEVMVNV